MTEPTTPYAPAPATPKRRNKLGIVALILAIVACLTPLGFFIGGAIMIANDPLPTTDAGWSVISAFVYFAYGFVFAGPIGVISLGLGIGSMFIRNASKVPGIVAIVLSVPLALITLAFLPLLLDMF